LVRNTLSIKLSLSNDLKLTVLFRVEPDCLGPDGERHVQGFCDFAQKEVESIDSDFVDWCVTPMFDKLQPEIEYKIGSKKLTNDKVARYLEMFDKNQSEFEAYISEKISLLISQYLEH